MVLAKLKTVLVTRAANGGAEAGKYFDGGGLLLLVKPDGRASWVFRYERSGKRREMELGALADVGLAAARKLAAVHRDTLAHDGDPLESRHHVRRAVATERARAVTFRQAAETFIASRGATGNGKHNKQWTATLERYAFPQIGNVAVADVDRPGVLAVLEPIWHAKHETARRVRQRIEAVLDAAHVRGQRTAENPARRLALRPVLGDRRVAVEHHPFLPWAEVPAFLKRLRAQEGLAARALELAILTATRTNAVLGARWEEFDGDMWTVPKERMKGKEGSRRAHRVPLSAPAMALLKELRPIAQPPFVFPGAREGKSLSGMAMLMTLRRMQRTDFTVHGFRSSFRSWCADNGKMRELAEAGLAHAVKGVEGAYLRSDIYDARRVLMAEWGAFCDHAPAVGGGAKGA